MKSLATFLLLVAGFSSTYTFAQSDSTLQSGVQGVVLKVAPAEYLLNQYPTLTIGTEWLINNRLGLQAEYGWGRPSFTTEQGDAMRTWLYRLEGRRYFRPHFSRKVRGYLAMEFLQKQSNESRTSNSNGTGGVAMSFDYSLRREVFDYRVKGGLQRMGSVWVWDIFVGLGVRHINSWHAGVQGRQVFYSGSLLAQRPGKFTGLYPALGFKVGWLIFRKK